MGGGSLGLGGWSQSSVFNLEIVKLKVKNAFTAFCGDGSSLSSLDSRKHNNKHMVFTLNGLKKVYQMMFYVLIRFVCFDPRWETVEINNVI